MREQDRPLGRKRPVLHGVDDVLIVGVDVSWRDGRPGRLGPPVILKGISARPSDWFTSGYGFPTSVYWRAGRVTAVGRGRNEQWPVTRWTKQQQGTHSRAPEHFILHHLLSSLLVSRFPHIHALTAHLDMQTQKAHGIIRPKDISQVQTRRNDPHAIIHISLGRTPTARRDPNDVFDDFPGIVQFRKDLLVCEGRHEPVLSVFRVVSTFGVREE